jgi:putative heme transporter
MRDGVQRSSRFDSVFRLKLPMMVGMQEAGHETQATQQRAARTQATRRQLILTGSLLAVLALVCIGQWKLMSAAARQVANLPAYVGLSLIGAIVLHRLIQSALVATVTGTIGVRRAFMVNEAHVGCSNAIIGGGAIGTGFKAAMLHSWGLDGSRIATSIAASSVIPMIMQWVVTAAAAGFFIGSGDRSGVNQLALFAGLVLSLGPLAFWTFVLTKPGVVRRAALRVQPTATKVSDTRLIRRALKRQSSTTPHRAHTPKFDLCEIAERMRVTALPLLGRRGALALLLGFASQLAIGLILVIALSGLGQTTGITFHPVEVMATLAMARTLGSFGPLPGGIGLLDAGLLASLMSNGMSRPSAVAAVAIYRASTFIVPMITGFAAIVVWRRSRRYSLTMPARTAASTA